MERAALPRGAYRFAAHPARGARGDTRTLARNVLGMLWKERSPACKGARMRRAAVRAGSGNAAVVSGDIGAVADGDVPARLLDDRARSCEARRVSPVGRGTTRGKPSRRGCLTNRWAPSEREPSPRTAHASRENPHGCGCLTDPLGTQPAASRTPRRASYVREPARVQVPNGAQATYGKPLERLEVVAGWRTACHRQWEVRPDRFDQDVDDSSRHLKAIASQGPARRA